VDQRDRRALPARRAERAVRRSAGGPRRPKLTFHGLRHSSATIALDAGVPVQVVSERLGHVSVSITMDVYAHVLKHQEIDAAERIGGALYGTGGPL
jgi:integrase